MPSAKKSIALFTNSFSNRKSLKATIESPMDAVTSRTSRPSLLNTVLRSFNPNLNAPPNIVDRISTIANKPSKVRLNSSELSFMLSSTPLLNLFKDSAKPYMLSDKFSGGKILLQAVLIIVRRSIILFILLYKVSSKSSRPLGLERSLINSFSGVPVFSASAANSFKTFACSSV